MSVTLTTTSLSLIIITIILLGFLGLWLWYKLKKNRSNRESVRRTSASRFEHQRNIKINPVSGRISLLGSVDNLQTKENTLITNPLSKTVGGTSLEKIPTDSRKNTTVFIKKPKRMTILTSVSAENDFSRPYYNVNDN